MRRAFGDVMNPNEEMKEWAVEQNPSAIQCFKNPSYNVQMIAVRQNPYAIMHIENAHRNVQLFAVQKRPRVLQHIRNPSLRAIQIAIKCDPRLVQYVGVELRSMNWITFGHLEGSSDEEQIATLQEDGLLIEYIRYQKEAVKQAAVQQNGMALVFIKKPSIDTLILAARQNPYSYGYVETSEETDSKVLEAVPEAIASIEDPTLQQFLNAKDRLRDRVKEFADPEEKTQRDIMKYDPELFKYIKNPTPESVLDYTLHQKNKLL